MDLLARLTKVVDEVVHLHRHQESLALHELWASIENVFIAHFGFEVSPALRADLEGAIVERRLCGSGVVPPRKTSSPRPRPGYGNPYHVKESTSAAQDNAIRALEGD